MNFKVVFLVLTAVGATGCSNRANYDYNENVNFSLITTYAWLGESKLADNPSVLYLSELSHQRMMYAIENQLMSKGLQKVTRQQADVLVAYHTSVTQKLVQDFEPNSHYSFSLGHHYHRNHFGWSHQYSPRYREYKETSLVISFFSPNQELIWRGGLDSPLRADQTPVQRTEAVNQRVSKILSNLPLGKTD
jgi:hypothetical protein